MDARARGAASCPADVPRGVGIGRLLGRGQEAAHAYREFGLKEHPRRKDITGARLPKSPAALLAAFTINELADSARERMLHHLLTRAARGDRVLIVEPLSRL